MPAESTDPSVNQKTIAKHLNVSVATVSKALNNKSDISDEMRMKVKKAAHELGYKNGRTSPRRQPTNQQTKNKFIGVFIRKPLEGGGKSMPTYLDGLSRAANEQNVSLIVQEWEHTKDTYDLLTPKHQPTAYRDGLLSGVALGGEWPAEVVNALSLRQPVVLFPQPMIRCSVNVVSMNNDAMMMQIVDKLKGLGHQRVGFLGCCGTLTWANERFAAYVGALDRLGLPFRSEWAIDVEEEPMLNEGFDDYWQSRSNLVESAHKDDGAEAWVCSSDWSAFQLYRGMTDRGYKVPRDLSITGFDDAEPGHLGYPPITSVRVPREVIGKAVLKRLMHLIENPNSVLCQSSFDCQLIANGTIGKPTYAHDTSDNPKAISPFQINQPEKLKPEHTLMEAQ